MKTPMEKLNVLFPYIMTTAIIIPDFIAEDLNLSPLSKLCYGRLLRYAGENCHCSRPQKVLSKDLCVSVRSIERALQELTKANYIHIEHSTGTGRLDHTPNTYYFLKNNTYLNDSKHAHLNPQGEMK